MVFIVASLLSENDDLTGRRVFLNHVIFVRSNFELAELNMSLQNC